MKEIEKECFLIVMDTELENEPASARPGRRISWSLVMLIGLFVVWLTGQVVRDRFWLTGICFYFPSIVMALLCLAALLLNVRRKARRAVLVAALLAIPPVGVVLLVENQWTRPKSESAIGDPLRLVHWNVGYGNFGWSGIQEELIRTHADLYVLSEASRKYTPEQVAAQLGPEYTSVGLRPMIAVAKGKLSRPRLQLNEGGIQVYSITWTSREGPIEVFVVDFASNPLIPRDPPLRLVAALMEKVQPDLVVGDFNAPRRSSALTPPPQGYVHAYHAAGYGWSATWPLPCPVLAIDQCLLGERIQPLRYDLVSTYSSDHKEQLLDFLRRRDTPPESGQRASLSPELIPPQ